jgi:peptide/nickel transport system ATP-binding protein/oligopeptide transport system ATP-binding protein
MSPAETLLAVRGLRTCFRTEDGVVRAVDGLSFRIGRQQTFALVGESGCGKSVTALSILQLVPRPPGWIDSGRVELDGRDLLALGEKRMRQVRGGQIGMVFQEPMSSLNPVYTCGSQIVEAIRLHRRSSGREARALAADMLARVGIPAPAQRLDEYPHQLSGGMRQRVMIAMALSCNPRLLIADEPTTALDVTIQAQILDLLNEIQAEAGLSIMLITHDLAVVAETADVVGVMYASRMAELAGVDELFADPLHPYTRGLFRSLPRLGERKHRLDTIPGSVPDPLGFPPGCKFHPRCPVGRDRPRCRAEEPPLREVRPAHWVACWQCPGHEDARATDPAGED